MLTFPYSSPYNYLATIQNSCAVSSMDRVADFESVGWGFESLTACQNNPPKERFSRFAGGFFARDAQERSDWLAART